MTTTTPFETWKSRRSGRFHGDLSTRGPWIPPVCHPSACSPGSACHFCLFYSNPWKQSVVCVAPLPLRTDVSTLTFTFLFIQLVLCAFFKGGPDERWYRLAKRFSLQVFKRNTWSILRGSHSVAPSFSACATADFIPKKRVVCWSIGVDYTWTRHV